MSFSDIEADVLRIFGDTSDIQVKHEDMVRWVNDAQLKIARETDCLTKLTALTPVVGVNSCALPSDFLKFKLVLWDTVPMIFTDTLHLKLEHPEFLESPTVRGTPRFYYKEIGNFFMFPAPEVVSTSILLLEYVSRPETVVDDAGDFDPTDPEIPEEYWPTLKSYLLARCYELDENYAQAATRDKQFVADYLFDRDDFKSPTIESYPSVRDLGD